MPFRLSWAPPARVDIAFHGDVSARDLVTALGKVVGNLHFDQLRHVVCDFRGSATCTVGHADLDDIGAVVYAAYATNPRIVAIAIATDPDTRALVEQFIGTGLLRYPLHTVTGSAEAEQVVSRTA